MGTTLEAALISVGKLFGQAGTDYEIPIYQRNYSWGVQEIEQLIDDVWAAAQANADDYFLGNLIVAPRRGSPDATFVTYEVIDGQQRLTTLFMLLAYLQVDAKAKLTYQSRRTATDALARLTTSDDEEGAGIHSGFKAIESRMGRFTRNASDLQKFTEFLTGRVQLVRAALPDQTDLNKYFEIMNTRGQQLAQVDIVKARLMSYVRADDGHVDALRACLAWVWDACADMDSYIQMALTPGDTARREQIFGAGWDRLDIVTFEGLTPMRPQVDSENGSSRTAAIGLRDAARHYSKAAETPVQEDAENRRFESPIKFPSLLLHALKVLRGTEVDEDDGQLDDSHLIKLFDAEFRLLTESQRSARAKLFAEILLGCKFVLDNCVIKREFTAANGEDGAWSLKRLTRGETVSRQSGKTRINPRFPNAFSPDQDEWEDVPADDATRQVLLIESMLRVTYTSPRTMHWITAIFQQRILGRTPSDAGEVIRRTLRQYARKKVRRAFFADERPTGFDIERIAFTYLDYLLATGASASCEAQPNFAFVYRNSIEHFFPQYADREQEHWDRVASTDPELHMFGNLALISVGANSKFSNNLPENKTRFRETIQQSSKLQVMADQVQTGMVWDRNAIRDHDEAMVELIRKDLRDGGQEV